MVVLAENAVVTLGRDGRLDAALLLVACLPAFYVQLVCHILMVVTPGSNLAIDCQRDRLCVILFSLSALLVCLILGAYISLSLVLVGGYKHVLGCYMFKVHLHLQSLSRFRSLLYSHGNYEFMLCFGLSF